MFGKLIVVASLLFSLSAHAGSPVIWGASGGKSLVSQICFPNAQCITGSGAGPVAWGDITGTLSNQTDLATALAGKQASGSYLTALTGDVTASGPGSAAATIASGSVTNAKIANGTIDLTAKVTGRLPPANVASYQYPSEKWVETAAGDDSGGDGSFQRPWLTLAHACATITTATTLIHMTGAESDQSSGPISCPVNLTIVGSQQGFEINQPITMVSSGFNSFTNLVNLTLFSTFTQSFNDVGGMEVNFQNVEVFGATTVKQAGAGKADSAFFAYGGALVGLDALIGQITLFNVPQFATVNYEDSAAAFLLVFGGDLAAPFLLNGGVTSWFTGALADSGYSITGATTGSGTPAITADSGSIPPSLSGATSLTLTSYGQYVSYAPADNSKWASTPPATVKAALDRIAAVVGGITPIP